MWCSKSQNDQQYSSSHKTHSMVSSLQVIEKKDFTELRICYEQKIKSLKSTTYRGGIIEWG